MSDTRDNIMNMLAQYGITNKTVEDIVEEFKGSDILAQYVIGVDDVETQVLAHIADYLVLQGVSTAASEAPADPTKTAKAGAGTSMPAATTPAQDNAIYAATQSDYEDRQKMSAQAHITAVLADKPYPGDWMKDIGALPVKGEVDKLIESLKAQYQPTADVDALLSKADSWFIPTNAQLQILKTRNDEKRSKTATKDGKPKADPAWVGFDNDAAYTNIMNKLTTGSGNFDVMVAPKEDTGTGANKEKAWRWNTKGFSVKMPETASGATTSAEKDMTKKQLIGFLVAKTTGSLSALTPEGLSCKLRFVSHKVKEGAGTNATEQIPSIYVKGNAVANHPDVRFIKVKGNGQTKMTCRSKDFYFVVRVSKDGGVWSVRKQRLPLQWEQAPTFETLPKYVTLFPVNADGSTKKLSAKDLAKQQEVQAAFVRMVMKDHTAGEYGMQGIIDQVEERVNKNAATAAANLAL